jgi:hypothetical protein
MLVRVWLLAFSLLVVMAHVASGDPMLNAGKGIVAALLFAALINELPRDWLE